MSGSRPIDGTRFEAKPIRQNPFSHGYRAIRHKRLTLRISHASGLKAWRIWLQTVVEEEDDRIQESPRQGLRPAAYHADLVDVAGREVEGDRRVGEAGRDGVQGFP